MSTVAAPSPMPSVGEVLRLIRTGVVATRGDVARVTGLSRTAVTARLAVLLDSGLVVEGEEAPSTGGRPPTRLRFNASAGVVLAGALGRSRTQAAVCDLDGDVLRVTEFEHAGNVDETGPDHLLPRLVATFEALLAEAGVDRDRVRGIGLSIPGTVDTALGTSVSSPIMRGWDGVPLRPFFASFEGVPVHVDNDAKVLALSESGGHLQRFADVVVLKASTGLACGVVADGRLVRGHLGAAGEIGHTKNPAATGRPCRCGDTGCLESIAAGWALVQDANAGGQAIANIRELVALAAEGDADARMRIRDSGRRVGEVLAGVVNLLNPAAVVVGGDMAPAYDTFVAGLRETLYAEAMALASRQLEILPSTHGARAGVVGSAHLALLDVLSPARIDLALAAAR